MSGRKELMAFVRSGQKKKFAKGEAILRQGDLPSALYAVRSGYIKAYDIASDGSEQLVWLAKRGDIIPLESLFSEDGELPYFYAAFTDVETYIVDKTTLLNNLRNNTEALMMAVEALVDKYRHIMSHLSAAQKPRARDKVVHLLHFISMRFSHKESEGVGHVEIPLTHQDFANLVGLARETTTLELRKLKQQGIVDYDKNNFYINTETLAEAME
jgi:CRP/FNR family transcriptional regulator, cyclic AMP receptor protein